MGTKFRLEKWNGRQISDRMKQAVAAGIDETTAAAVNQAKSDHGWGNVTGTAEGSIQMRPAVTEGSSVVGQWGSFDVDYFIFLEIGTAFMEGDDTLRRAADAEYPNLHDRIRNNYR